MGYALTYSSPFSSPKASFTIQSSPSLNCWPPLSNHLLPRGSLAASSLAFSRRSNRNSPITPSSKNRNEDEKDIDEDAFGALFNMLEEDLTNDKFFVDDDDDLTEEGLLSFQHEFEEVIGVSGDGDDDDDSPVVYSDTDDAECSDDTEELDDEEERPVKLRNWQLRRLASALKKGRRKVSIKSLAGELCLDRAVVLDMLRDPPPNLVLLSAALPDEPAQTPLVNKTRHLIAHEERVTEIVKPRAKEAKVPVHVMIHRWDAQKRLKKVHVDTLEKVYRKTKRPTNTMVSSIVQVTNLPRKKVVKWFEDKRNEDGVPEQRIPYQRSVSNSASS